MKANNAALAIGIAGLLVIFAAAGYMIGSKSNTGVPVVADYTGAPAAKGNEVEKPAVLKDLEARLKENPDDPKLLAHLGDIYFEMRKFDDAIKYYEKAIEQKPDDVDSYNDLGLSNHYIGRSADGLKIVEEGIEKNPYHQRIWLTKGFILAYGMGNMDEARAAWEKARALDPESQIGKAASDFLAQFKEAE